MKKLCIIPARGGSKRLPGKNIKLLNGKPLTFYTIDAVIKSEMFDKIIFTSDSVQINNMVEASYSGLVDVVVREKELATDTSKVIDTVISFLDDRYHQTWLTLPTSPLKLADDYVSACNLLTNDVDSVLSYTEMEFPPTLGIMVNEEGIIQDHDASLPWQTGNTRSQDHPTVYRPNGALYGSWTAKLRENKNYYVGNVKGHYMPRSRSIDIDTLTDFKMAEYMLKSCD